MTIDSSIVVPTDKKCCHCKHRKPIDAFNLCSSKTDGRQSRCKDCSRIVQREWIALHPDKDHRWRKAHPGDANAAARSWKAKNRTRLLARRREISLARRGPAKPRVVLTREGKAAIKRKWVATHRDRSRAASRRWRDKNKSRCRAYRRGWFSRLAHGKRQLYSKNACGRRRARKRGGKVTRTDLAAITKRDRMVCYLCHRHVSRATLSFDHVTPLARGGSHSPENLRVVHLRCNIKKGANLVLLPF